MIRWRLYQYRIIVKPGQPRTFHMDFFNERTGQPRTIHPNFFNECARQPHTLKARLGGLDTDMAQNLSRVFIEGLLVCIIRHSCQRGTHAQ